MLGEADDQKHGHHVPSLRVRGGGFVWPPTQTLNELQTFIHENRSCPIANKFEREIDFILEYYIDNFSQNIYAVDY